MILVTDQGARLKTGMKSEFRSTVDRNEMSRKSLDTAPMQTYIKVLNNTLCDERHRTQTRSRWQDRPLLSVSAVPADSRFQVFGEYGDTALQLFI